MSVLRVPFPGFYDTWVTRHLDDSVTDLVKKTGHPHATLYSIIDWAAVVEAFAKSYVSTFDDWVCDNFEATPSLRFNHLAAPRAPAWGVEKIYAHMGSSRLAELLTAARESGRMEGVFTDNLKAPLGLRGRYPQNLAYWLTKPLWRWPPDVAGLLLACLIEPPGLTETHVLFSNLCSINAFDNAVSAGVDWDML